MPKIYIDAGHGGSDCGATKFVVEKDVNLKVSLAMKNYLIKYGCEVMMSREEDIYKPLIQRVKEANEWGADVYASNHANAGGGNGAEVFHSIVASAGKDIAKLVLEEIATTGQNIDRGIKSRRGSSGSDYYYVIRATNMPAIINEVAFVDNKEDAKIIDTDEECYLMGEAIGRGILKYFNLYNKEAIETKPVKPDPEPANSYLVKVTAKNGLNIRTGAGVNFEKVGCITDNGTYTIVETVDNWGRLKSGIGWICLDYVKRL